MGNKNFTAMKNVLFPLSIAVAMLTSCATTTTITQITDYMESSARVLEPEHSMLLTPIIADLKVSETKIYHTETEAFANLEVTPNLIQNISELKKIALSRAARAHKADVLVGSSVDVVTKNGRLEIVISGYPAYYTKFRNAATGDIELLKKAEELRYRDGSVVINAPKTRYDNNKLIETEITKTTTK